MSKVNISIEELFELGAHFGHRKRFWNPYMEDYIFCEKNNIHIIDLYKTQEKIVELYETFRKLSSVGNKVMIVGTKRVASSYVSDFGIKTGMPYISHRWLGGMLTNWKTIKVPINKLLEYEENKASGQLDSMIKKEAVKKIKLMEENKRIREELENNFAVSSLSSQLLRGKTNINELDDTIVEMKNKADKEAKTLKTSAEKFAVR